MKNRKTCVFLISFTAMTFSFFFCGCGRSDEQIVMDVKPAVEKILIDLDLENPVCVQLWNIRRINHACYKATAEVEHEINAFGCLYRKKEMLDISIVYRKDAAVSVKLE